MIQIVPRCLAARDCGLEEEIVFLFDKRYQIGVAVTRDYKNALHLLAPASPHWQVPVQTCSALTRSGIDGVWQMVERYRDTMDRAGALAIRRAEQAHAWMWSEVSETLLQALRDDPRVERLLPEMERAVAAGRMAPGAAARQLVGTFRLPLAHT